MDGAFAGMANKLMGPGGAGKMQQGFGGLSSGIGAAVGNPRVSQAFNAGMRGADPGVAGKDEFGESTAMLEKIKQMMGGGTSGAIPATGGSGY